VSVTPLLRIGADLNDRPSTRCCAPSVVKNAGIFLDRDGTLIVNRHYLSDPAGVELLPGVRDTLHHLLADGYRLFLFTNQSGVGRGMFSMEAVNQCNDRLLDLLGFKSAALMAPFSKPSALGAARSTLGFTDICVAPEAPDQPEIYRKPSPRFILEMITKHGLDPAVTWMVGDSAADVQAGVSAGVRTAWLAAEGASGPVGPQAEWTCRDLRDFYAKLKAET
jgi:D-glycero-D-manno-heptose 1,7-bisphosphate phosphatase